MDLGKSLLDARKRAGITQSELADAVGVRQKDVSIWENNKQTPSAMKFRDICIALNESADVILELR